MKMSNNPAKYELLIKQCLRSISPGHKCLFQAATCFWIICKTKKMKFAVSNWYTEPNRQTHRQTGKQTERQTDRQTVRQSVRQRDRQADRQ